jgi:hypothetical protein
LPTKDKQKDSQHAKTALYNYSSAPKNPLSNSTESNSIKKLTSTLSRPKTAPVSSSTNKVITAKSTKEVSEDPKKSITKNESVIIPANDEFIKRETIPTALQSTLDHIVGEVRVILYFIINIYLLIFSRIIIYL